MIYHRHNSKLKSINKYERIAILSNSTKQTAKVFVYKKKIICVYRFLPMPSHQQNKLTIRHICNNLIANDNIHIGIMSYVYNR